MNSWLDAATWRGVLPVMVIAGAVLYGVHDGLLKPQEAALAEARQRYDVAYQEAAANGTLRIEREELERRLAGVRERVADAMTRSRAATDQREMFERITAAASASGVDLEQLRSIDWKPRASASQEQVACVGSACEVSLLGSYNDVRTFLGTLETRVGFTSVTRLRIRPATEGDRVRAEVEVVSLASDTSASSATLGAVTSAMEGGQ